MQNGVRDDLQCRTKGCRGVARIFQGGGGSHWVKQYRHGHGILQVVSLKERLTKGGSRAPHDPPSYALGVRLKSLTSAFPSKDNITIDMGNVINSFHAMSARNVCPLRADDEKPVVKQPIKPLQCKTLV